MHDDFSVRYQVEKPIWMARLSRAEGASDVMDVTREFVRTHADLWAWLPTDCQPPPFTVADDISHYALTLYRKEVGEDLHMTATLHALASFFSEAAHRMATVFADHRESVSRKAFLDRQS
jgi:hypothetical protein